MQWLKRLAGTSVSWCVGSSPGLPFPNQLRSL
jgi:hypothetical protein